jgi:hypothetical protein
MTTNREGTTKTDDPMAKEISWRPLKGGGYNFRTHQLIRVNDQKMKFRASRTTQIISFIMVGFGLYVPIYHTFVQDMIESGLGTTGEMIMAWGFGIGLVFFGIRFWLRTNAGFTFDKSTGQFIKNGKDYASFPLDEIHAIQLILERIKDSGRHVGSSSRTSFTSYEINLIKKDGKRIHLIDHSNRPKIREDAEKLGEFLEVPVWDRR